MAATTVPWFREGCQTFHEVFPYKSKPEIDIKVVMGSKQVRGLHQEESGSQQNKVSGLASS